MPSREAARNVVGIIGNIISLILFTSPVPTFIRIWRKGSVEQYSAAPYLATLINCGLWTLYGLPMVHPNSILVLTINGTGFGIELLYLLLFVIYADRRNRLRVLFIILAEIIFIGVLAVLVLNLVHSIRVRSAIVGSFSIMANIMMYASPLSIMRMVIRTKSVEYMPFFLSLASLANGICWTSYALISRFDAFIAAPNGVGSLFGLAQVILYATYYKSTRRQNRQSRVEMGPVDTAESDGDSKETNDQAQK